MLEGTYDITLVSKAPGETSNEVIATYNDGTRIRIRPSEIQVLPDPDTEIREREKWATWIHLYGSAPGYALERLAKIADEND